MKKSLITKDNKKHKLKLLISILSYIQLLSPILSFLFIILSSKINKWTHHLDGTQGYGLGCMMLLSIPMAIFFGIPSIFFDFRVKILSSKNKDISNTLRFQLFCVIPCVLYWFIMILGSIFRFL